MDLGGLIAKHAAPLHSGDVVVVTQKVVSKEEGRLRDLATVVVTERASQLAVRYQVDPRMVQAVLDESVRVIRDDRVLLVETHHGFICVNAGIDKSNVPGSDTVSLLPLNCNASALRLRERIASVSGVDVAIIISDTFGSAWRHGLCDIALAAAGMPLVLEREHEDDFGVPLPAGMINFAIADELAGAAELIMGKARRLPAVVVSGLSFPSPSDISA